MIHSIFHAWIRHLDKWPKEMLIQERKESTHFPTGDASSPCAEKTKDLLLKLFWQTYLTGLKMVPTVMRNFSRLLIYNAQQAKYGKNELDQRRNKSMLLKMPLLQNPRGTRLRPPAAAWFAVGSQYAPWPWCFGPKDFFFIKIYSWRPEFSPV